MRHWYLFLDDERSTITIHKKNYIPVIIKDYNSMIKTLIDLWTDNDEVIIDLDHDLGEEKTGYDICKWIVENKYPIVAFHLHTMNPVGYSNMRQLLSHYGYKEI